MTTKASNKFPPIEWEKGEFTESHPHAVVFSAKGIDDDGNEYSAEWVEIDSDLIEILNIQKL